MPIVTKFGGTSVSSRENWDHIADITAQHLAAKRQVLIVCSALTQVSNQLEQIVEAALLKEYSALLEKLKTQHQALALALEVDFALLDGDFQALEQWLMGIALLQEAPPKTRASILSLGELMMTRLGQAFLQRKGFASRWLDAREVLLSTPVAGGEGINYLAARCKGEANPALAKRLADCGSQVLITQGFIAANEQGETVLLGRGGSDTSAALFAAILQAEACEIWTDVPGIYTANPHQLPNARLLKQLNYDEAQEIASMGAKVLHPNCIPPVRRANIPMYVKYTKRPDHSGTRISQESDSMAPQVKSIQVKHGIRLISIDSLDMWQQVGFLAEVFGCFKAHGFSVDLLSSSEFNLTVSLDAQVKLRKADALECLLQDLNQFGRATMIESCSVVSLVGHPIRGLLPNLGPSLELFAGFPIYLMSLASNDLNLSFVVEEAQADKLCQKLHGLLIEHNPQSFYYSKSWREEFGDSEPKQEPWWQQQRAALLKLAAQEAPCYVYSLAKLKAQGEALQQLSAIDQRYYAIKANPHPQILQTLAALDFGFEAVSVAEIERILASCPGIKPERILFTPNFAPKAEYAFALALGCQLTLDNIYPLTAWPELFHSREIILRVDLGTGAGHHKYVCTGGNESKFGIPRDQLAEVRALCLQQGIRIIGLHSHSGSGILSPGLWAETAMLLAEEAKAFDSIRLLNLGGGLGVVEKPGQQALDLNSLNTALMAVKTLCPGLSFYLEPGRYLVAEAGVLLARVTQVKAKGREQFVGVDTGMNSLIRPALYGAYHEIVNLTRLEEEKAGFAHVVGPICESGDTLGYERLLPRCQEADILLIATAGAYGHCMSSEYNLRKAAVEHCLPAGAKLA